MSRRRTKRRRFQPQTYAVAFVNLVWVERELKALRRRLDTDGLNVAVGAPRYPRGWLTARLDRWLYCRRATCLERSLLMQRWLFELGEPHTVLIGVVSSPEEGIAHAWLDHEDSRGHVVLTAVEVK